jgi:G3E family GTPase
LFVPDHKGLPVNSTAPNTVVPNRSGAPIPATILTGFLGAGKTTLLNRILSESHGMRIAVIENEFGPESIDNELLEQPQGEQIVEMNNGCVCCTVRGDLIRILGDLATRRASGEIDFDRVVIETTGMANPGPVTQTFFADDSVAEHYKLDGVVTVVDAKHGHDTLNRQPEAQDQVGFADRLLLSKTDLVTPAQADDLRQRLVRMNPRAPIMSAHMGQVALNQIFGLGGFNLDAALTINPDFLQPRTEVAHGHDHHDHGCDHDHHDHEACCDHDHHEHDAHCHHDAHHHHDDAIKAFVYQSARPFDTHKLEETLSALTQVYGPDLLRYKGVLFVRGSGRRLVLQGVHMMMGLDRGKAWERHETPGSKLVFIGRNLPQDIFRQGLESCLVR